VRIVVVGATGNVGTSVLGALADEPAVDTVLGIARRIPKPAFAKTDWVAADVVESDLATLFRGADVVIHLAWLIQPSRDEAVTRAVNVDGSRRVFAAVKEARVPALVYASSVGAYSPGPKRRVDESWPTAGIPTSFYSRHKAEVERLLDDFERESPEIRVVRLRPALIFKREAASEIRRLFAGPFLPSRLVREGLIPVLPLPRRLAVQAVHSLDVGDAYRLAALDGAAHGAFNIAAEPVLDPTEFARVLGARPVAIPERALRAVAAATYRMRLQPSEAGWIDLALQTPLLDTERARAQLGWSPRHDAREALRELLRGIHDRSGIDTPPLAPDAGGPMRARELLTGVGQRIG
jgi:nucleoside-diphosphate-sugar epimerase